MRGRPRRRPGGRLRETFAEAAPYRLGSHPGIADDLTALSAYGPAAVAAARAALDDLAHGRVTGNQLGIRRISGDLSGLASVKFDAPAARPGVFA